MSNDVQVNNMQDFQKKVIDKLKTDIGEMIPDNVLDELVKKALHDQFFKTQESGDSWNKKESPSWFVKEVAKVGTPVIQTYVKQYVKDHEDEIKKHVDTFLSDQNLSLVMIAAMSQATQQQVFDAAQMIVNQIVNR